MTRLLMAPQLALGTMVPLRRLEVFREGLSLEAVVESDGRTCAVTIDLRAEELPTLRRRGIEFIAQTTGDENALAVQAIGYLRGAKPARTPRARRA